MGLIRILLIADTHLGFDLPFRPRIKRRRRGPDFFANFERALMPALKGEVQAVVHGGDVVYRSKVPARLVEMAFEPLKKVADSGVPVYLVPGNHERSAIPHGQLAAHPNIHLFDRPRTYRLQSASGSLALAGFPFVRTGIRSDFLNQLMSSAFTSRLTVPRSVPPATHFAMPMTSFAPATSLPVLPPFWPGTFTVFRYCKRI
jgi:hypothetical protein